ncbi:MAG: extracellular solute-binding protein [Paracoccaceae bacterium]|nr:extracellular solute-binding protein [Paracoccaceae bacterium]
MRIPGIVAALIFLATPAAAENHETIASHGISAFGELRYPAGFPHFDYVNPDAPKGGTMSFRGTLASSTFDSLNWFILAGEPAQGLRHIYDQLMVRAFDEPDSVYGSLAEQIEYPEDRSWVIYTLREGATFSDGEPVQADDVAYTIDILKSDGNPRWQILLKDVEGTEVLSDREVKVTFAADAQTRDLISTVGQLYILPRHYYETVEFNRSTLEPPVGSGPYVISDVEPGRNITYCRNPDYWAADLNVNVGTWNFDCFRYEYFTDTTAAFEALKAGVYLFHEEFFSAIWATGYDFPALDAGHVKRETIGDDRSSGAQGFWLNLRREKFQDRRVREAVGLIFNFEWSNETLFYGLYNRTDSFWENSPMQAAGPLEGEELGVLEPFRDQLPARIFTEDAFVPPVSTTRKTDRRLVRRAAALLDEAGWMTGSDGFRRNAAGETLTLEILDDGPSFERIALPFIENLKLIGIDASWELIDPAQYEERQENFDYDVVIGRFSLPLSPSVELNTLFGSDSADRPGTFNLSGVQDPVVDALIEQVIAAKDRETLTTRVKALDRVLRDKIIWVPNWYKGSHWIAYWDVFGFPDGKPPFDRGTDYWWFDQEKYDALIAAGVLR